MISKSEIRRKLLHLATAAIPLFYKYMFDLNPFSGQEIVMFLFAVFGGLFVSFDLLRKKNERIDRIFKWICSPFMRNIEDNRMTGATRIAISFFIVLLVFPENISVPACLLLSVGDAASAIVGQQWGKMTWYKHYTVEGTLAFIVAGLLLFLIGFPAIPVWKSVVTVVAVSLIEVLWDHFDDNIVIPLAAAAFLFMLDV